MMKWKFVLSCSILALSVSAFAREDNQIRAMVAGGSTFEVSQSRQLTTRADGVAISASISPDGRLLAGILGEPTSGKLTAFMVSTEGGHVYPIVSGDEPRLLSAGGESLTPNAQVPIAWSPDGKIAAVPITQAIGKEKGRETCEGVALFNRSGHKVAQYLLENGAKLENSLAWSGNSRWLAVPCVIRQGNSRTIRKIWAIDCEKERGQFISLSDDCTQARIDHWGNDGRTLFYISNSGDGEADLRQASLEKANDTVIAHRILGEICSPGGAHVIYSGADTLKIAGLENPISGKFAVWAPSGKLFLYAQTQLMTDELGKRKRKFNSLWLRSFEDHPMNHLLVTVDMDTERPLADIVSCSSDCLHVSYISNYSVYVVELDRRKPTNVEKVVSKMSLSEAETKEIATEAAKSLALGLMEYAQDWDGKTPDLDTLTDDITPYLGGPDLLALLQMGTDAFKYNGPQNFNEGSDPANTVVATYDSGRGWTITLYGDGHVVTKDK